MNCGSEAFLYSILKFEKNLHITLNFMSIKTVQGTSKKNPLE